MFLVCFLSPWLVMLWNCPKELQCILTRLFGKIRVTNSPSSLWGEKYVPFEVATEITTLPLQRCAPVPSFSPGTTIFRSQQKLLAMQPFLFTGKKAIFPANTGREKRWQWLPTTLMCHYDFNQFVPHNPGLRLHFSFFLERLGKIGQGRQHVNSLRAGKKKNNLMDCFGTSSQLHRFIHPHPRTQGATALLLLLFFSRQSARTELVHSLSPWLLKQRHRKQFCRILAIYMMSSCLTAPIKNIHTTSSAS